MLLTHTPLGLLLARLAAQHARRGWWHGRLEPHALATSRRPKPARVALREGGPRWVRWSVPGWEIHSPDGVGLPDIRETIWAKDPVKCA